VSITIVALYGRRAFRALKRYASPICLTALGLWIGLACKGGGAMQLAFAVLVGAFVVSWTGLLAARERERILLCAVCVGFALSAGVLRFQAQQSALGGVLASLESERRARGLSVDAVEGRLDIDSQTTARKNRRLELRVRALELVGPGLRIRCEWKRPVFTLLVFSETGPKLFAGTEIRAESLHGGDFIWVDARDIRQVKEAGLVARLRALLAGYFARAFRGGRQGRFSCPGLASRCQG